MLGDLVGPYAWVSRAQCMAGSAPLTNLCWHSPDFYSMAWLWLVANFNSLGLPLPNLRTTTSLWDSEYPQSCPGLVWQATLNFSDTKTPCGTPLLTSVVRQTNTPPSLPFFSCQKCPLPFLCVPSWRWTQLKMTNREKSSERLMYFAQGLLVFTAWQWTQTEKNPIQCLKRDGIESKWLKGVFSPAFLIVFLY